MILSFDHLGATRQLNGPEDVSRSLDEVFNRDPDSDIRVKAEWVFLESEGDQAPVSILEVSANIESCFGGVVWFAGWDDARRFKRNPEDQQDDLGDHFWLSDSENPPKIDPEVMSDHYSPLYFDPQCVLPIAEVRKVVEEYCEIEGNRPTGIQWVAGTQGGSRFPAAT
ncbi:Imm1 family immunity protein [Streptomyces sp. NPDC005374]|uniref:Imm1 family immunity protein n=1 Tax=Streptomyces sp. NPDC005374 TaxID=3364713 RepID=UPI0036ACA5F1